MRTMLSLSGVLFGCLVLSGCSSTAPASTTTTTPTSTPTPSPTAAPALTLSATALTFPTTTVGQTAAVQNLALTNSGTATLTLTSVTLSDTRDYTLMNTCGASLAAAASCIVTVSFTPATVATLPATLTFTDNAANSPQTVTLTGSCSAVPVPTASLSASVLTFPVTAPAVTSAAQTVTLTNTGSASLTGITLALTGTSPADFAQTTTCTGTLAPAATCTAAVTFTPAAASTAYTANLVFTDNSAGTAGSTQTVALSGAGAAPTPVAQATLSTTALTFPSTAVGSSAAAQTITLTNPGNATLTGIAVALSGTGFSDTNACGATLTAGGSCNISVGFTPTTAAAATGTLTVTSSAVSSPQTVALSGTGTPAPVPVATFSATSLTFPSTTAGSTSAAMPVTLTNAGSAVLNLTSIQLSGSTATSFTISNSTCGTTLAAAASCTLSFTFTPAAAGSYTGSIVITDNAAGSPQSIALSGTGTVVGSITHTMYAFPETDASVTPLYALINGATSTIDMTMYELVDTTFSGDLVAACNRGVKVRVILDQNDEESSNTPAYNQLNAVTNCRAAWANPAFQVTHEKSFVIDNKTLAMLSLNLTSRYYIDTRDYAWVENDPADIAAVEATFNMDYGSTTDYSYQPGPGTDLIWSPTTATADLLGIINGATKTLLVENEEMSATNIVSALEAACQRGVAVHIAMTDTGSYHANFSALEAAGCGVHTYPNAPTNTSVLYIHAKAMVADYGLSTQKVYMGSINFSTASMTENRELGAYITDAASIGTLNTTMTSDYAGASPY